MADGRRQLRGVETAEAVSYRLRGQEGGFDRMLRGT